jgi:phasin family protein
LCNAQKILDIRFLFPKIGLIAALHKARIAEVPQRSALYPAIDAIAFQELDMSLLTPEQIAAAQKANLESLFGLTTKAFEGVEKLIELNLQVVKSTLAEGQENAQRLLSVKDAQELIALQASLSQPVAEKVLSYGRHLYEIASSTQAEFAKVAEAQFEEQNKKVQALVDNVAKNAPAGSETAVAALKSALNAANTTYETVQKATKQAVEIAETNFNAAAAVATKAATAAAARRSSKPAA